MVYALPEKEDWSSRSSLINDVAVRGGTGMKIQIWVGCQINFKYGSGPRRILPEIS